MPRSLTKPTVLIALAAQSCVIGCATVSHERTSGKMEYYQESSADVVNRAPSSMSLPTEQVKSPANDAVNLRTQADYHFALGETFSLQGDVAKAIEEYKLTLIYDPSSPQVHVRLAGEYLKQSLLSEAQAEAKKAIALDPKYVDGHIILGGLYTAQKMYEEALAEYRTVIKFEPENYESPLYIGAILAEQKKYKEASEHFDKLAKNPANPNAQVAWYYLGRIQMEQSKEKGGKAFVAKAEASFQASLKAKPDYTESVMALAQIYLDSDRRSQAEKLFITHQEKYGPSTTVAEELARLFIEDRDYNRAFQQLAIIENADPSDINVKAKMAYILIDQKRYPEAIARLEAVLALDSNSDKIRFYLGAVYEEVKDYKAAVAQFMKVPYGSSYFGDSVVHASYLYKILGNYEAALETVRSGIRTDEDNASFYALYASLLDETKQYDAAVVMLKDATKRFPQNPQLMYFLGSMEDRVGHKDETIASMNAVLQINKDHIQALNFLAYTYAESGKNLDQAESMARRAMKLQPEDGYILDTLGWVLYKRGKTSEAIRTLEAAYKIQPEESVIAEHLGDVYYHSAMPEKAKKLYMRAAENEANVTTVERIRSKLAAVDKQNQGAPERGQVFGSDESARKPASIKSR